MKRATNASATAATAVSQVQQPAVNSNCRINPITAAGGSADSDKDENYLTSPKRTEPYDATKAMSRAMSRLLAVDTDNYMLRKGALKMTTTSASSSSTVATVVSTIPTMIASSKTTCKTAGDAAITSASSHLPLPLPLRSLPTIRRFTPANQQTHRIRNTSATAFYSSSPPSTLCSNFAMNGNAKHQSSNRQLPVQQQSLDIGEGLASQDKARSSDEPTEKPDQLFVEKNIDQSIRD